MDTSYPVLAITLATATAGYLYYRKKANLPTKNNHEAILNKNEFRPFELEAKQKLTHNVSIYRFKLPKGRSLGLPIGQHIQILLEKDKVQTLRSYTPITKFDQLDYFELIVKTYPEGKVSSYLSGLELGNYVYIRGPRGSFNYTLAQYKYSHLCMICGGTGIAPMYQLIQHILLDKKDKTKLTLIYGNVSVDDILLKDELDTLEANNKDQIKIHYLVDKLENENVQWNYDVGYVTKTIIQKYCPSPDTSNIKVLVCGPPLMVKSVCRLLEECGYDKPRTLSKMEDMVFKF